MKANKIMKMIRQSQVEWKTLGEAAKKISSGGTPKTGIASYYDGDIPWLRTQEVNFGEIWDTGIKITADGVKIQVLNGFQKIALLLQCTVLRLGE